MELEMFVCISAVIKCVAGFAKNTRREHFSVFTRIELLVS